MTKIILPALIVLMSSGWGYPDENAKADGKISALIVDGFSNHDWRLTTQLVRQTLEQTGRFEISESTCPGEKGSEEWNQWRPEFSKHDVVIQNCNNIGSDMSWPRPVEVDFERYVREGGGVYILHSANNAFSHWEEYDRMIGLGWRSKGQGWALEILENGSIRRIPPGEGENTHHGKRLDTVIHLLADHPINQGYPKQWKSPSLEVYQYARGPAENLTALSYAKDWTSGKNWPIEWVVKYGQGNVYNSTLGHVWKGDENPAATRCLGFQTTLIRALEWLATGSVSWPVPDAFPTENELRLRP